MIPALLGSAGAVVVVAIALVTMSLWIRDAERGRADARVDAQKNAGLLAISEANAETWKQKAAAEKRRADGLDLALDEAATDGDAAGARSRVLSRWSRELASDHSPAAPGADPGAVHQPLAAEGEQGTQPDGDPLASRR